MSPSSSSATNQKPTHARYWVVVFALSLAILSYIDRVALSKAAPRIQETLGINEQNWGMVVSAFGLGYALFEIPGGFLGDWLGPKKVLIRIVLWWSGFTALMGWMWNGMSGESSRRSAQRRHAALSRFQTNEQAAFHSLLV